MVVVTHDPDEVLDCVCTDVDVLRPICPECRDGKHTICIHEALTDGDEFVDCACGCETSRTCPSCRDVVPVGFTLDDHLNCNWPGAHDG